METFWNSIKTAWRRELWSYFASPLAYVFMTLFLLLVSVFSWELSRFFDTGAADLTPFFYWHPWLYILFMPALSMRLWADEAEAGTAELLLSLPVSLSGIVTGKFLAAWSLAGISLALTLPWWLAVNLLGPADNAAIGLSYMLSLLMAGGYIALGLLVSALTPSAVLAFVMGVVFAFMITIAGWPLMVGALSEMLGPAAGETLAQFSFLTHFETAQRGVLEWRGVIYYLSFIALCLTLTSLLIHFRRRSG